MKREKNRMGRMGMMKEKIGNESVVAWHCCVDTLLDYMGQRRFRYSDVTAARKICTAV
jgi:hypothetical protein